MCINLVKDYSVNGLRTTLRRLGRIEGCGSACFLVCNGKVVSDDRSWRAENDVVVEARLRVRGGKGGFGSLLRQGGRSSAGQANNGACTFEKEEEQELVLREC